MTYETIITKELKEKETPAICNPTEIYRFISLRYKKREQPQMLLFTLGESFIFKNVYIIHTGKVKSDTLDIMDIMLKAIKDKAEYISICYIRPSSSGLLRPSNDDYDNAGKIFQAAKIMNITVLNQVIVGDSGYTEIKRDGNNKGMD
jgi:DNA repair protein RadC